MSAREPFDLEELQNLPLPRAGPEEIHLTNVTPEENADYVQRFLPVRVVAGHVCCVGCGDNLFEPGPLGAIHSTFDWGLEYGKGHCTRCGYPTRMYHRVGKGGWFAFPLQYHPDELERRRTGDRPDGGPQGVPEEEE